MSKSSTLGVADSYEFTPLQAGLLLNHAVLRTAFGGKSQTRPIAYENDAEQDLPLPSAPGAGDASVLPLVAQASRDKGPGVQVAGWEQRG